MVPYAAGMVFIGRWAGIADGLCALISRLTIGVRLRRNARSTLPANKLTDNSQSGMISENDRITCSAHYALLMNKITPEDEELRLKRINTWIAGVGALGVAASIWFGFRQLAAQAEAQTDAIRQQWATHFYDEKLSLYAKATETAAKIAALKSQGATDAEMQEIVTQFRILFWGPMCVTEGPDVEKAMVLFGAGLDSSIPAKDLQQLSLYLAHVCRNEAHALYVRDGKPASHYGANDKILPLMKALSKAPSQ